MHLCDAQALLDAKVGRKLQSRIIYKRTLCGEYLLSFGSEYLLSRLLPSHTKLVIGAFCMGKNHDVLRLMTNVY
jgi:hypothetical protein